eukprot:scaffold25321_cov49-Phaeocystis_antarctica.AAC.2
MGANRSRQGARALWRRASGCDSSVRTAVTSTKATMSERCGPDTDPIELLRARRETQPQKLCKGVIGGTFSGGQ